MSYWINNKPSADIMFTRRDYAYSLDATKELNKINLKYNPLRDNETVASLPIDSSQVSKFLSHKYIQSFDDQSAYNQVKDIGTPGSKAYDTAYDMVLDANEYEDEPVNKKEVNRYLIEELHIDAMVDSITDEMDIEKIADFMQMVNDRCNDESAIPMDSLMKDACLDKYADLIEERNINVDDYENYKIDLEYADAIENPIEREDYEAMLKDQYFGEYDNPDSIIKAMDVYAEAGYFDDYVESVRMQFIGDKMIANDLPEDYESEYEYDIAADDITDEKEKHARNIPTITPGDHVVILSENGKASIIANPYEHAQDPNASYEWYDELYKQALSNPTPDDAVDKLWPDGEDSTPARNHAYDVDVSDYYGAASVSEQNYKDKDLSVSVSEEYDQSEDSFGTDSADVMINKTADTDMPIGSEVNMQDRYAPQKADIASNDVDHMDNNAVDSSERIEQHKAIKPVPRPESEILRAQPLSIGLDEPFRVADVFPASINEQPEMGGSNHVIYYSDETLNEFNKVMNPSTQNFIQKNKELAAQRAEEQALQASSEVSISQPERTKTEQPEITGAERQAKYLAMIDAVYQPEPSLDKSYSFNL